MASPGVYIGYIVVNGWGVIEWIKYIVMHVYKGWNRLSMRPNGRVIQVFVTKGGQGHRELETVLSLSTNNGL